MPPARMILLLLRRRLRRIIIAAVRPTPLRLISYLQGSNSGLHSDRRPFEQMNYLIIAIINQL
jgi:hypothetical protein